MKKTELLFPTPLWTDDDVGLDLKPIQDFSYEVRKEDPQGRQATNDGGWQSNEFKFDVLPNTPFKYLYYSIMDHAYEACDQWGFMNYSLKLSNLWININGKGHSNNVHTHAGCIMSGVYYVKIPTCCCGELKFHKSFEDQCLKEYWGCNENFDRYSESMNHMEHYVTPKENTMILFPSWLLHSVDRSASDEDRISISFNIFIFSDFYRDNEVYPKGKPNNSKLPLSLK